MNYFIKIISILFRMLFKSNNFSYQCSKSTIKNVSVPNNVYKINGYGNDNLYGSNNLKAKHLIDNVIIVSSKNLFEEDCY